MGHVSVKDFKANLDAHLDDAARTPLTVERPGADAVVVMSERDYAGMMETFHLLKSPANADRLMRSIAELDAGRGVEHDPTA